MARFGDHHCDSTGRCPAGISEHIWRNRSEVSAKPNLTGTSETKRCNQDPHGCN